MELRPTATIFLVLLAFQVAVPLEARPAAGLSLGRSVLQAGEGTAPNVSFARTEELLLMAAEQKPYKDVLVLNHERVCGLHLTAVLPSSCDPAAMDPGLCCAAIVAFFDEGLCLCEPRLQFLGDEPAVQNLLELAPQCGSQFPLPNATEGLLSLRGLEQCRPILEGSAIGELTPEFIGLTAEELAALDPMDIPRFDDLYEPAFTSKFKVNTMTVNVTRKYPSVLSNPDSTATTFNTFVLYPDNPKGAKGKFPLIGFGPGLGGSPRSYLRTLTLVAAQGAVVVSPLSTQWVSPLGTFEEFKAYGGDVASSLAWVLGGGDDDDDGAGARSTDDDTGDGMDGMDGMDDDGMDDGRDDDKEDDEGEEFAASLLSLVDTTSVGLLGHSYGGALVLEAAAVARRNFSISVEGVFSTSPICVLASNICDTPYAAAPELDDTRVKFFVGELDEVSPPAQSELFNSRLPESATGQVMVLEGGTHCFTEEDPKNWPLFSSQCGKGTVSPFEHLAKWHEQIVSFFKLE